MTLIDRLVGELEILARDPDLDVNLPRVAVFCGTGPDRDVADFAHEVASAGMLLAYRCARSGPPSGPKADITAVTPSP